jgi:hypothetical protein
VKPVPGGASDENKPTGFGCSGPSDKSSDWIADQLTEVLTDIVAWGRGGFRLFRLGVVTALALRNHSLALMYVDILM